MDETDFKAEYAKSDRSTCKLCRSTIDRDSLRLAIMVQSPAFDGRIPTWYHYGCFFKKVKPKDVHVVKGFAELRWEDQQKIKDKIHNNSSKSATDSTASPVDLTLTGSDVVGNSGLFSAEYAKSNRSTCRACSDKIDKDVLRVSKKNYSSETASRFGPADDWYHLDCFFEQKQELEFNGTAESFSGFADLYKEDQTLLKKKFGTTSGSRKRKGDKLLSTADGTPEEKIARSENDDEKNLREQSELLWSYKDALRKEVPNDILKEILRHNEQHVGAGEQVLIDSVADCMAFGALEPCPECGGLLVFSHHCYRCNGDVTEWTKCQFSTTTPVRKTFKLPTDIKKEYDAFKNYKSVKRDRVFPKIKEKSVSITKTPEASRGLPLQEPEYDADQPLKNCRIAFAGRLSNSAATLQKLVERMGGNYSSKIDDSVDVVISTSDELKKMSKKLVDAQTHNIHVVPEHYFDDVKIDRPSNVMEKLKISSWGILPHLRRQQLLDVEKQKQQQKQVSQLAKSDAQFKKSMPDKAKIKIKGGAAVDPDSGLDESCHVVKDEDSGEPMTAVLGLVDVVRGTNSYYKVQLLEEDKGRGWYLFRSWGRVGTTIGDSKLEKMHSKEQGIESFEAIYLDKTGNHWSERKTFQKVPRKFFPLEIDYGQQDNEMVQKAMELKSGQSSKLEKSVQDLVRMIFDVKSMEKAMLEFEIDLTKMPLGKLSKNQIEKAYKVLTELQTLIQNNITSQTQILDASNRFYTLIPHDFGMTRPPLLDNLDIIKNKTEMIDNLLEIEVAYSMLESSGSSEEDPIDTHYRKLKCGITPVDKTSKEFQLIEEYIRNTHAATHHHYDLKLVELFKTDREGEIEKFNSYQKLDNHKLLWHGSRTTNFAGILSQGLRIAPPEAPVTGYMFGKGVYFADMVSKSANYCFKSKTDPNGVLLLCEVALGSMYECNQSTQLSAATLPKGKHSCKGCGQTVPDPKGSYYTDDGIEIPMGKGIPSTQKHSSLLYNEFIVYDTAQINMKYLLRVDFIFKY